MSSNNLDNLSLLPVELIDSICICLKNSDLENLRLSCKTIQCRVDPILYDPILYDTFTLYSHKRSFKNVRSIAEHEVLRSCVKTLIYDTSFIPTTELALELLARLEGPPTSQTLKSQKIAETLDEDVVDTTDFFGNMFISSQLTGYLPCFSRLEEIVVIDTSPDCSKQNFSYSNLPKFYKTLIHEIFRTEVPFLLERAFWERFDIRMFFWPVLMSMAHRVAPIINLRLKYLYWVQFLENGFDKLADIFSQSLGSLELLELQARDMTSLLDADNIGKLSMFLSFASSLKTLQLHLQTSPLTEKHRLGNSDSPEGLLSMFTGSRISTNPSGMLLLPTVQSLTIQGLTCTYPEFKGVFRPLARSLTRLHLFGLDLTPPQHRKDQAQLQAPRACLVRAFRWIQKHLHLESVELSGGFFNFGAQQWYLGGLEAESLSLENPNLLLPRLKRYLAGWFFSPGSSIGWKGKLGYQNETV